MLKCKLAIILFRLCIFQPFQSECLLENFFFLLKFEEDVQAEFDRIKQSDLKQLSKSETLVVSNIVKKFKKKKKEFYAVNHVSFGVENKECFGLLGMNGAGMFLFNSILRIGENSRIPCRYSIILKPQLKYNF
jgi:hypothetical protein